MKGKGKNPFQPKAPASKPPPTAGKAPVSGVAASKGAPRHGPTKITVPKLGTKMKFPQQGKKAK